MAKHRAKMAEYERTTRRDFDKTNDPIGMLRETVVGMTKGLVMGVMRERTGWSGGQVLLLHSYLVVYMVHLIDRFVSQEAPERRDALVAPVMQATFRRLAETVPLQPGDPDPDRQELIARIGGLYNEAAPTWDPLRLYAEPGDGMAGVLPWEASKKIVEELFERDEGERTMLTTVLSLALSDLGIKLFVAVKAFLARVAVLGAAQS